MIEKRGISLFTTLKWSWFHVVWLLVFAGAIATLYDLELLTFVIP